MSIFAEQKIITTLNLITDRDNTLKSYRGGLKRAALNFLTTREDAKMAKLMRYRKIMADKVTSEIYSCHFKENEIFSTIEISSAHLPTNKRNKEKSLSFQAAC